MTDHLEDTETEAGTEAVDMIIIEEATEARNMGATETQEREIHATEILGTEIRETETQETGI